MIGLTRPVATAALWDAKRSQRILSDRIVRCDSFYAPSEPTEF